MKDRSSGLCETTNGEMLTELTKVRSPEDGLVRALYELRAQMWDFVPACKDMLESVHPDQRKSACKRARLRALQIACQFSS